MSSIKEASHAEVRVVSRNDKPKAAAKPGPKPPEEAFWQRYSANHECILSAVSSFTVHALALVFIVMSGWLMLKLASPKMLDLDTITIAGGGGSREGEGNARGDQPPVSAQEDVEKQEDVKKPGVPEPPTEALKTPNLDPLNISKDNQEDARYINESSEAIKGMRKLSEDSRKKIFNAIGPGKGIRGPGRDGGEDSGRDIGKDKYTGPGKNTFSQRQKRVLRWVMKFNTLNGNDYRKQLQGLGAILAFSEGDGKYRVYRNLNQRPPKGEIEDLNSIKRIFWIDEKPESIASLSQAMGLETPDGPIIAFFPVALEAKLLKMELAYRGKKESEIKRTEFKIEPRSGGTYEPKVVDQE